jgi:hypothetical protein
MHEDSRKSGKRSEEKKIPIGLHLIVSKGIVKLDSIDHHVAWSTMKR